MPSMIEALNAVLVSLYLLTLGILTIYGIHRYVQVYLYFKHHRKEPVPAGKFSDLPRVTVQLPMYNEMYVAERIIEGACGLDYPREKLQIQVLDDSTDESREIARECCDRMRRGGHNVQYIHRTNRQGYKAGALANGLSQATGEFVVIFDADFVPTPSMLRRSIDFFTDPNVGCVQTRWDHINRTQSMLTRCQAIFLDGHFMIEHTARNCSGRFINFNGTAGIWRRKAIEDSGGWQHDTLTEDVDLSYRAQLRGWQFVFLKDLLAPAELPPEIVAFKQQQHRWTKGQVQTAVKLLPSILRAPLPLKVKVEAFFHLTNTAVYLPAIVLSLILFPVWYLDPSLFDTRSELIAMAIASFCGLLTASAGTFYMLSQKAVGRSQLATIGLVPFLMAIGMGISVINGVAVLEGLFGRRDTEFVRTPKYGTAGTRGGSDWKKKAGSFKSKLSLLPFIEVVCGVYLVACIAVAVMTKAAAGTVPFLCIFAFGYLYVGLLTFHSRWLANRARAEARKAEEPAAEMLAA
ncbi:MAG TPA: cellulose synthase family protein [Phycisphaerae bacterium]|nr:cellulose synthase family protein [Phycisphaerae bacterium]